MSIKAFTIACLLTVPLCLTRPPSTAAAEETAMTPKDFLSSRTISVRQSGGTWTITGARRTVTFLQSNFSVKVDAGPVSWIMRPSQPDDLAVKSPDGFAAMPLTSAEKIAVTPYDTGRMTGIKIDLSGFKHDGKTLDCSLQLFLCLEGETEELICDVTAVEGETKVRQICWPKAIMPGSVDTTVVPAMQGMLVPDKWPGKVFLYDTMSFGRGLYMPWWGFEKGKAAAALILETPDDAGCVFDHPAGGPTLMEVRWVHSLGSMAYPRRARIAFLDEGNYVTLAKRYRRYVMEKGRFVSLKEKIARSPLVEKLVGSPVVHFGILTNIQPESSYYNKTNAAANHYAVTFDARAAELKALSGKGVSQAYVHLDGWGFRGYDNLHPDLLPPAPEAGGWEGMKRFADTCEKLGYVFAIHDQYRDYYLDAASYQERHTVINEDGGRPLDSTWYGGRQSILCPRFVPGYVQRNHRALLDHGVKVKGAYLDVFAVVPPDECYSKEHPATRSDCLKYRVEGFNMVRAQLGVVSSEEPADYAVPHLDLVHHGPYALDPGPGKGPAMGIPVPLFNLVYHDSIILPWTSTLAPGGWGIPDTDSGYLHALLNAGIPYLSPGADDAELARMKTVCILNKRVALLEMTKHEFLDETRRKQKTTFADGTAVTVDFDTGKFSISE